MLVIPVERIASLVKVILLILISESQPSLS